jgi:hypothetical protein
VYGASRTLLDPVTKKEVPDPVFDDDPEGGASYMIDSKGSGAASSQATIFNAR